MKFHPFNIKYVEKIKYSNEIIFHDDIHSSNFKFKMDYEDNYKIKQFYEDSSKNIENIYALMYTDISSYLKSKKDFLLHGDIYFLKKQATYVIFSFLKYTGSSSIKNHGFFLLNEERIGNQMHLLFNSKRFANIDNFFRNYYIDDESDFQYIGNAFIHNVEDFIFEPFSFNKTYKLDFIKEKNEHKNNNFYHHSNFLLLERNQYEVNSFEYFPQQITPEIVDLNERNFWELSIEKMINLYNYREGLFCDSSIEFITGFLYECNINQTTLNTIKYKLKIKENSSALDERSIIDYMKFFIFYTHKGIVIESIKGNESHNFYFDDMPIGFDIWSSFNIESDRNEKEYIEELLKIF